MMQKVKHFFYILLTILLFQSCSIYTSVHFNKNYSGNYKTEIDLSGLMGLAMMMDTTGQMTEDQMFEGMGSMFDSLQLRESYENIEGISNVSMTSEEGKMVIKFDFADLEALNQSYNELQSLSEMDQLLSEMEDQLMMDIEEEEVVKHVPFVMEGKKTLIHRSEPMGEDMGGLDMLGEGEDMGLGEMGDLGDMFDVQLEFSFDRKIKKLEVKGMEIQKQDKRYVKTKVNMSDVMKNGNYEISFKLK